MIPNVQAHTPTPKPQDKASHSTIDRKIFIKPLGRNRNIFIIVARMTLVSNAMELCCCFLTTLLLNDPKINDNIP